MKTVAIIQARMNSTRLPGKVLKEIAAGKSVLRYMIERVQKSAEIDCIVVATGIGPANDAIAHHADTLGVNVYRGSEEDVLSRFYEAAKEVSANIVVRLTADCPAIDPAVIDKTVQLYKAEQYDYCSNVIERSYPDGLDVEVFSFDVLEQAHNNVTSSRFKEHVTPYMRTGLYTAEMTGDFKIGHLKFESDFSHLRWTLDTQEDYTFLKQFLAQLPEDFSWLDAISTLLKSPDLLRYNRQSTSRISAIADLEEKNIKSSEIPLDNKNRYQESNTVFEKAIELIPLASQTFSKSFQQVAKGAAPLFLEQGKGAYVYDIDGNEYIDYVMGLLPNVLGYNDPDVDAAILRQLDKGITFSMPSCLEYQLAERLVNLIPCAEQVRFGKNGSDATSAAIRLARAHTGRDKVIVCGYHGWHDWYIGTTTRNLGVPNVVQEQSIKLDFGDFEKASDLFKTSGQDIAAIILEPCGPSKPPEGYLKHLRELCDATGTVLIFDEIITGFRAHLKGAQYLLGVTPDLACFGKAMANGLPISAVVGKKSIMKLMEEIFFSGTFGGETLSLAAACATIDKLTEFDIPAQFHLHGATLKTTLNSLFEKHGFQENLQLYAEDWWPLLKINSGQTDDTTFKTLLRQELNAAGILLNASFNLAYAHIDPIILEKTEQRFDMALSILREAVDSNKPEAFLKGDLIQPTFAVRNSG